MYELFMTTKCFYAIVCVLYVKLYMVASKKFALCSSKRMLESQATHVRNQKHAHSKILLKIDDELITRKNLPEEVMSSICYPKSNKIHGTIVHALSSD